MGESLPPGRRQRRRHTPICGDTPQRKTRAIGSTARISSTAVSCYPEAAPTPCANASRNRDNKRSVHMSTNPNPPNIDQRLEALTQSVELIAKMQLKTEKELRRLGRLVRTIILDHEARLLTLEGREPDDEEDD